MKAKKFVAPDMRQALKIVRDTMGADAVILSNRKVAGGVEVSVATDYYEAMEDHRRSIRDQASVPQYTDGSLQFAPAQGDSTRLLKETLLAVKDKERRDEVRELLNRQRQELDSGTNEEFVDSYRRDDVSISTEGQRKQRADNLLPPKTPTQISAERQDAPAKKSFFEEYETRVENEANEVAAEKGKIESEIKETTLAFEEPLQDINQMRNELQQLRSVISSQLGNVAWGDFSYRHPISAAIFKRLVKMGLSSTLARSLSQQVEGHSNKKDAWHHVLLNLASRIPVHDAIPKEEGIIAFVGPAGVGKTTTIAKLASDYVLKYGPENLALVTTDSYRIAGHEQLRVLSKILKVPLRVVAGNQSLESALQGLQRKKMILIDTAGLSHKDVCWEEQISALNSVSKSMETWLVLSTTSQRKILDKTVMNYKRLGLDGCVLTKMDESASLGEALSVVIEHRLSVAYTTNGQNIPDDIDQVKPKSLVNQAIALTKEATLDDELAADCFHDSLQTKNGAFTAA